MANRRNCYLVLVSVKIYSPGHGSLFVSSKGNWTSGFLKNKKFLSRVSMDIKTWHNKQPYWKYWVCLPV